MKKWIKWLILGVVLVVLIVVGIGFIPVTKTTIYTCTKQRAYSCTKNENHQLTYNSYGQSASQSFSGWVGCVVDIFMYVTNTDNQGGQFAVEFYCSHGGTTHTLVQEQYLNAGQTARFGKTFDIACGESWDWSSPVVRAPTIQRLAPSTCYETYDDLCTKQETKRLFWPK